MCGIWGYICKSSFIPDKFKLFNAFQQIKHRGPDRSSFYEINEFTQLFLGFHRLAIMDKSTKGDQPFILEEDNRIIYCLCNGEIYNFHNLINKYNLKTNSISDCEVLHLIYKTHGLNELVNNINGEFAFAMIDIKHINTNKYSITLKLVRDPCGIRPLFYGIDDNGFTFGSEMKSLINITDNTSIKQLTPGSILTFSLEINNNTINHTYNIQQYYKFNHPILLNSNISDTSLNNIFKGVKKCLKSCVIQMLEADRPIGALLSGGLDSSLVVAIAAKYMKTKYNKQLHTFSIGMPNATDKKYAALVAKHCNTIHTHIEFSTDQFLNSIKNVIWATETYDITTIRASTGQYLISEWIAKNTNIKVLLIGDGSDELCSGYIYFHNAPDIKSMHRENKRLLKEIHLFDVLRADRGIAAHGLEARVPFLNHKFIDYYLAISPAIRMPTNNIEKWLLRKSFSDKHYLPKEVLWRKKEAFSDGVSSTKNSWYTIIQNMANIKYSNDDLLKAQIEYKHCPPNTKEALYYREIYNEYFTNETTKIIPHYWLPLWCGVINEPSARILDHYNS